MDFKKDLKWIKRDSDTIPEGKLLVAVEYAWGMQYGVIASTDGKTILDPIYYEEWKLWDWKHVSWYIVIDD